MSQDTIEALEGEAVKIREALSKATSVYKRRAGDKKEAETAIVNLEDQIRAEKAKDIIDLPLYAELVSALEDTKFLLDEIEDAILEAEQKVAEYQSVLDANQDFLSELKNQRGKVIPFDRKRSA
jgi:chromosome segregation ATPase